MAWKWKERKICYASHGDSFVLCKNTSLLCGFKYCDQHGTQKKINVLHASLKHILRSVKESKPHNDDNKFLSFHNLTKHNKMWWCLNLFVPVDTINLWWFSLAKCSAEFTDLLRHHHAMISTSFLLSLWFYCPFTFYCWCYCHITALSCYHFVCKSILSYRDLIKGWKSCIKFHSIIWMINCFTFNSAEMTLCGFCNFYA